eukprot:superscaffoldBa00000160_g2287
MADTVVLRVESCMELEWRVFSLTPVMSDYYGDKTQKNSIDGAPIYTRLNPHVPVLAVYFDGQRDVIPEYRLGLCRLVHTGVEKIAAFYQEVIRLPTAGALDEVGQGFAWLANSPVFSRCVCAMAALSSSRHPSQDQRVRITSTKGSSHLYNCRQYVMGRASSSTSLWGILAPNDGGYHCIERPMAIITLYEEPLQGRVQSRFNHHHAKACSIIEQVFGMLKTQWRLLFFRALEVDHTLVPSVITACAVLHNICHLAGDILEPVKDVGDIGVVSPWNEADMASVTSWQGFSLLHVCTLWSCRNITICRTWGHEGLGHGPPHHTV